ncbi:MAG TPA: UvrD-helicase domain-containing protein, partial [Patescibacteria group bacterium]
MKNLLEKLNPAQRAAVETSDGPVLIIAGAGSGKTKALTHRVAYLIKEKRVNPRNILAVTFTNKAATEMKKRVMDLLESNQESALPTLGTFHSVCGRILRSEIDKLGYKKNFSILDSQDQLSLAKKVVKELGINADQFKPSSLLNSISHAKNELIDERAFAEQVGGYFEEVVSKVYTEYQKRLRAQSALDFDDMIMLTVKIFQNFPDTLEKYRNIFRYIMVDEYQDTNHAQYMLVKLLAEKYRNICVVGDDWQGIYSWRGANIQNILDFEKDYPEAKTIKLEQNYRSTQTILDAAYGVISKNINRKDKQIWTENKAGHRLISYEAPDEKAEAEFIVSEIKKLCHCHPESQTLEVEESNENITRPQDRTQGG